MSSIIFQADINAAQQKLRKVIERSATPDVLKWLEEKLLKISFPKDFYFAFSSVPRFIGNLELVFTEEDLKEAQSIRKGWNPSHYTSDRAARIVFLLSYPHDNKDLFLKTIETLFSSANINEQVALYSALPLLPYPESFISRTAEGIRTNIRDVFDAVALDNPYASEYFSEEQWNQMVLKAIFTGRPLFRIYGIDERRNERLSEMLIDFAHERWAAGRTVTPELWRCVAPFLNEKISGDIKKLSASADLLEQQAVTLVLKKSDDKNISWNLLGEKLFLNS